MSKSQLKRAEHQWRRVRRAERYGSRRVKTAIRWMQRDEYTAAEIVDCVRYAYRLKI